MMKDLTEHDICSLFGKNIKKYRTQYHWSQEQLAEQLDVSATFLSNVERGKAWISPKTIAKLCNVLKIETYELFITDTVVSIDTSSRMDRLVRDIANSVANSIETTYQRHKESRSIP